MSAIRVCVWTVILFLLCVAGNYACYACKEDIKLGYDFPLFLMCASGMFEIMRRYAEILLPARHFVSYLSQRAFGIYFLHIIIMKLILHFEFIKFGLPRPVKLLALEIVPIIVSVLLIEVLSHSVFFKKYVFGIK